MLTLDLRVHTELKHIQNQQLVGSKRVIHTFFFYVFHMYTLFQRKAIDSVELKDTHV